MAEHKNFSSIQIKLASPETIRSWSHGEVTKSETINYRTLKPEPDGLFCEKIFGPKKDYECYCGKYKKSNGQRRATVNGEPHRCDTCHVEITKSSVRREYMGHIHLASPVVHLWYFKGTPCYLKLLLSMSPTDIEKVIYLASYVVLDPGDYTETEVNSKGENKERALGFKELVSDERVKDINRKATIQAEGNPDYKMPRFGSGAVAIKELLQGIDLEALAAELREEAEKTKPDPSERGKGASQRHKNVVKRLEVIEAFIKSGNKPEWIVLEDIPVIPPELRPMVQLDGGRFATSDLNDLYRRVIARNSRLNRFISMRAPMIMIKNEMRMLQEAVDALIDNGRRDKRPVTGSGNRPLKSLTSMLKGKQGRFRQNLLGKRVDYSGRSVIVVGPELKMYQCGLPKEMALELFKPFVIKRLVEKQDVDTIKKAKPRLERPDKAVWEALEEVIKDHPVLLNRAPTLHRLGIQAFEPVLVEGKALKLHPLVCTAYNADFDGDQMAVHVPLSIEAQAEARFLMLASNNILKPQDGTPVASPTQDMVIGCYYLTGERPNPAHEGHTPAFYCMDEAMMAYSSGEITLQEPIRVKLEREWKGEMRSKVVTTTLGKLIFNQAIPQDLGYVDRSLEENLFRLEIESQVVKKDLAKIVDRCFRHHGPTRTSEVLDDMKSLGYKYSTRGGITVGYKDIVVPESKKVLMAEAETAIAQIEERFKMGFLSPEDRKKEIIKVWEYTTFKVGRAAMDNFDKFNPIYMMATSGARGSENQIMQLSGMRGLMNDTSGQAIEVPIKANFREGLNVLEFFVSSHGARKGLADTALRTADSGYLTRRLVDVSQDVIVREEDCFESRGTQIRGISMEEIVYDNKPDEQFGDRILGRYTAAPVYDPTTGELIIDKNELVTFDIKERIINAGIKKIECRSVFTCTCEHGVCAKCYGANLATGNTVDIGEAVGIIAAQAIGEPGTQLTMRTFHTGGVASADDITQGLPRVEEIFEARKPKGRAIITGISGIVSIEEDGGRRVVKITPDKDGVEVKPYKIDFGSKIKVVDGQHVDAGDELTEGSVDPHDILEIKGRKEVQEYLLREVQHVYRSQGVGIADKHIEIIIRQMLRKVQVEDAGDTSLLPGELVDKFKFETENNNIVQFNAEIDREGGDPSQKKKLAFVSPKLLGITKAALSTDSFLSAASFQETTRILTDAAIKGKVDPLTGLKENIILGKLIPAGIGMRRYRDIHVEGVADSETESTVEMPAVEYVPDDMMSNDGFDIAHRQVAEGKFTEHMFDDEVDYSDDDTDNN